MITISVFILAFIAFATSRAYLRYRDKDITITQFLFWFAVWTAAALLVFLPQTSNLLAAIVGIGRGVDAALVVGIIFMYYLLFRLYVKVDHIDRDVTEVIVRLSKKMPVKIARSHDDTMA